MIKWHTLFRVNCWWGSIFKYYLEYNSLSLNWTLPWLATTVFIFTFPLMLDTANRIWWHWALYWDMIFTFSSSDKSRPSWCIKCFKISTYFLCFHIQPSIIYHMNRNENIKITEKFFLQNNRFNRKSKYVHETRFWKKLSP